MRTTVTIDPDTEFLLKQEVQRTGKSFKVVLNTSIRQALTSKTDKPIAVTPLFKHPFPAALDAANMNHLADMLDDQDTLEELSR
jgi:hypothetical protein